MTVARSAFQRRILSALNTSPARTPVVVGGCGSGRSTLLRTLHHQFGSGSCQYINVERSATTPERFLKAVIHGSPFRWVEDGGLPTTPREAFDAVLAYFSAARTAGGERATFLLDEALEIRTFESFPGLRHALRELLTSLPAGGNRFILSTRFASRATRLLHLAPDTFAIVHVSPMGPDEVRELLGNAFTDRERPEPGWVDEAARTIAMLTAGRPAYVQLLADMVVQQTVRHGDGDPISSLSALLGMDGALAARCEHSYELRLHKARGYGALKAILDVLAEDEPLTLTEISQRLGRTPGSTKDYLSWLEDVDLVTAHRKRYRFLDPLLRTWVRLYCRALPATEDEVAREVRDFALARMPQAEPATPPA